MSGEATIDVCVCTYQRSSLWRALETLAQQALDGRARMRVILADNNETPTAETTAARARKELGLDLLYVHAPARNISIARNACLDAARAEYVAFIDDDEEASPEWLGALLSPLAARPDLVAVFGPVKAIYAPDAPAWLIKGDFFSRKPWAAKSGEIDSGYTSNALVRRAAIGDLRFEPGFGRSGGGDGYFFACLHQRGARFAFCESAMVTERIPAARANLRWRIRRNFRSGQVLWRIWKERGDDRIGVALMSAARVGYFALKALLSAYSPVEWRRNVLHGALHAGVLAKLCGARDLVLYGA
jgi:succinoglycan biosynthesis protein ExoM